MRQSLELETWIQLNVCVEHSVPLSINQTRSAHSWCRPFSSWTEESGMISYHSSIKVEALLKTRSRSIIERAPCMVTSFIWRTPKMAQIEATTRFMIVLRFDSACVALFVCSHSWNQTQHHPLFSCWFWWPETHCVGVVLWKSSNKTKVLSQ